MVCKIKACICSHKGGIVIPHPVNHSCHHFTLTICTMILVQGKYNLAFSPIWHLVTAFSFAVTSLHLDIFICLCAATRKGPELTDTTCRGLWMYMC